MCKPEAGMDRKTWAQQYIQSIRSGYIYSILSPKGYQIMAKTMLEICNYQVPNFNKRFNFVVTVKKKFLVVPWLPLGPLLVWWSLLPINVQGVIFFLAEMNIKLFMSLKVKLLFSEAMESFCQELISFSHVSLQCKVIPPIF